MTFKEYAEQHHDIPYVFELEKGPKKLVYYGSDHSNDPAHRIFNDIEQRFNNASPQIVIVEGIPLLNSQKDRAREMASGMSSEQVIKKFGEPGFAVKLAVDAGIEMESPEPQYKEEVDHLLKQGFSKEEVFAFYMYRHINQYHRIPDQPSVEEFLKPEIEQFKKSSEWPGFDYSIENLRRIGQTIWGENSNFDDPDVAAQRVDPTLWAGTEEKQTRINLVSQACNNFRDQFIVKRIREILKQYDRVFVVYGASHAYMQEPALKKIFESV